MVFTYEATDNYPMFLMLDTTDNPNKRVLKAKIDTTMINSRENTLNGRCITWGSITYDMLDGDT